LGRGHDKSHAWERVDRTPSGGVGCDDAEAAGHRRMLLGACDTGDGLLVRPRA